MCKLKVLNYLKILLNGCWLGRSSEKDKRSTVKETGSKSSEVKFRSLRLFFVPQKKEKKNFYMSHV